MRRTIFCILKKFIKNVREKILVFIFNIYYVYTLFNNNNKKINNIFFFNLTHYVNVNLAKETIAHFHCSYHNTQMFKFILP